MDRITSSYLDEFSRIQNINEKNESKLFEYFATYCVVSREYDETYNFFDVVIGSGGDCGIDAIAIIINGKLVESVQEIQDLVDTFGNIKSAKFIMVQAKSGNKFDGGEMGTFGFGVRDFFSEEPQLSQNDDIKEKVEIVDYIIKKSPSMKNRPECIMYYVTTGKWVEDNDLVTRKEMIVTDIDRLNIFGTIKFECIDAETIQKYYRDTKDNISRSINFENRVLIPEIENVREAYIGTLPAEEYLKLITNEQDEIIKSVFYENVRDYQGDNPVNEEIDNTLKSNKTDRFVILNNGVTIVCKELTYSRNIFTLTNYQIVNGCQTSHVIFNNRDGAIENVNVPIKLINTNDENTISEIIRATNRQTEISDEQFVALSDFHKRLEAFYNTFSGNKRLYYERRAKQYSNRDDVEKVRVVTINLQLKAVAAMFTNKPHLASRYYGRLAKDVNDIFGEEHEMMPYYTSAFCLYKLEFLFRNKTIDGKYRKYRFHMLMLLKYLINGLGEMPRFNSKKINQYCENINNVLYDTGRLIDNVNVCIQIINEEVEKTQDTDVTKIQSFNDKLLKNLQKKLL